MAHVSRETVRAHVTALGEVLGKLSRERRRLGWSQGQGLSDWGTGQMSATLLESLAATARRS
jgi:hypothetical protein